MTFCVSLCLLAVTAEGGLTPPRCTPKLMLPELSPQTFLSFSVDSSIHQSRASYQTNLTPDMPQMTGNIASW